VVLLRRQDRETPIADTEVIPPAAGPEAAVALEAPHSLSS
jgi:hypothetical protein